ncbi:ABC transporter permease,Macrolide export ATP-binding/permease protein MacB,macrolide transporter ATP-binding /permease protein,acidobacterial duplicated orphan permease,FtsX-like permease family [[Clostridium] sordellii]|uniref:ABC transporter permease n=1 Tax=Paraclostridium sordellii TaxID=1505 RepID=UPI0005435E59|nr:ABC transporter permease [Paeniclostridium sordellii]CEK36333.1 ABC transporter permease,Macrolide export ATP-binding/permease protein MacB,macrolide transporter ATP-binding /permease protein,acidobacterial duplicated orphan permease,FtsX-like permease family [[Clostridium] sordellii] [Paeniclostridium sordellii]
MKISFKLAIAYMKEQKGRTIALITSIALAVILVFALNVIPETQNKFEIEQAYKNFSDYHVEYSNLENDKVDKLKKDKEVTEINDVLGLGKIVGKNGISLQLNSYSKDFLDSYGYELIKGNGPKNTNEIVLEEKALKEMNLRDDLNQEIDFKIVKYYVDKNNKNQIFSKDKKFKLVGIVKKPDGYYGNSDGYTNENEYYGVKAFTKDNSNEAILPNNLVTHSGTLNLNTSKPDFGKINKMINKYGLDQSNFMPNVSLTQVLEKYEMSKDTLYVLRQKLYPMLAATLVICNIFSIVLIDRTKQIGILRAMGLTKSKVRLMMLIEGVVVLILGLLLGFLLGVVASYLGFYVIYKKFVSLYISKVSILEPTIMAIIAVLISSLVPIYKSGKISPIDAIRSSDKINKRQKNRFYYKLIRKIFGFTGEIAYKNLWRNKIRTILCILSISLGGLLFIDTIATGKNIDGNLDSNNMFVMMMGNSDIKLSHNTNNTSLNFTKYNKDEIEKISSIKEVKNVNPIMALNGYFLVNSKDLTPKYKSSNGISDESKELEEFLEIEGHSNDSLKNLEKYIENGENINNKSKGKYPKALVTNYFYSIQEHSPNTKLLNDMKIGDLIDIKIPTIKNNKLEYKNEKVEVAGILNGDYVLQEGGLPGGIKVVLNEENFKNISGKNDYNKINIQIEKGSDKKVENEISKIISKNPFSKVESKYNYKNFYIKQTEKNTKETLVIVGLILLISSINILCIIKANIMTRMKELSTLRAIGMSTKKLKNMIAKENIMYAVFASIVASVFASHSLYEFNKLDNLARRQVFGAKEDIKFVLPIFESFEFLIVSIIICLIAVFLCKKKIEKMSIVEGLNTNE